MRLSISRAQGPSVNSSFSSPTTGELSSSPTRRTASSTPGMNDSRLIESWRMLSVWPRSPRMHLLVGDQPRQAHGVDRRRLAAAGGGHQLGRERSRAAGRVELGVVVQLDDLGLGHVAGGLGGEAHHQHRPDREVRRDQHVGAPLRVPGRASASGAGSKPVVPITTCTPASIAASALSSATSGVREVDDHVGLGEQLGERGFEQRVGAPGELHVLGAGDGLADGLAHAPLGAGHDDADHRPRPSPGDGLAGREPAAAAGPPGSAPRSGPIPTTDRRSGSNSSAASSRRSSQADRVDPRDHLVHREDRHLVEQRSSRAGSCARRSTPGRARRGP